MQRQSNRAGERRSERDRENRRETGVRRKDEAHLLERRKLDPRKIDGAEVGHVRACATRVRVNV